MPSQMDSAIDRLDYMLRDVSAKPLQGLIKGKVERKKAQETEKQARVLQAALKGGETRELRKHFNRMNPEPSVQMSNRMSPEPSVQMSVPVPATETLPMEQHPSTQRPSPLRSASSRSLSPSRRRRVEMEIHKERPSPYEASAQFTQLDPRRLARPTVSLREVARRRALSIVRLSTEGALRHLDAAEALPKIEVASACIQGAVRGSCVRRRLQQLLSSVDLPERQREAARRLQAVFLGGDARLVSQGLKLMAEDRERAGEVIGAALRGRGVRMGQRSDAAEKDSQAWGAKFWVQEAETIFRELVNLTESGIVTKPVLMTVYGEGAHDAFVGLGQQGSSDAAEHITEHQWLCWVSEQAAQMGTSEVPEGSRNGYHLVATLLSRLREGLATGRQ